MRREATEPETRLWRHLSASQLAGHKFRRQHIIGGFIVDFFCPAKNLVVEVDGETHEQKRDEVRDRHLAREGITTLRITNSDVRTNLEGVLRQLLETLNSLPDRWDRTCSGPTPTHVALAHSPDEPWRATS